MNKKLIFIAILGVILIVGGNFAINKVISKTAVNTPTTPPSDTKQVAPAPQASSSNKVAIVSTNPNPLDENIIGGNDTIEITFNRPLENVGEFKVRIEPKVDFKVELSSDRKTAKIIPVKPFELGTTYTLFIGPETKFDGVGRWGEEKIFHFKTIRYTGV